MNKALKILAMCEEVVNITGERIINANAAVVGDTVALKDGRRGVLKNKIIPRRNQDVTGTIFVVSIREAKGFETDTFKIRILANALAKQFGGKVITPSYNNPYSEGHALELLFKGKSTKYKQDIATALKAEGWVESPMHKYSKTEKTVQGKTFTAPTAGQNPTTVDISDEYGSITIKGLKQPKRSTLPYYD